MCRDCATPGERVAGDLAALNIALHNLGQDSFPFPVMFIAAGLPSLPAVLADATSYAERLYDFRKIGLLDATSTSEALVLPAETYGVSWDRSALHAAVDPKVENYACPAAGTLSVPPASAKPATLLRRTPSGTWPGGKKFILGVWTSFPTFEAMGSLMCSGATNRGAPADRDVCLRDPNRGHPRCRWQGGPKGLGLSHSA
jgi:hypothetical protein